MQRLGARPPTPNDDVGGDFPHATEEQQAPPPRPSLSVDNAAAHLAAAPADHAPAESAIGGNAPPEENNARNAVQQQRRERRCWKTHEELRERPRTDPPHRKFSRAARPRYGDDPQAADVGPNEWQLGMSNIGRMNDMVSRPSIPMDVHAFLKSYWTWDYKNCIYKGWFYR